MAHTGSSVITSQQEVLEVGPSDFHVRYLFYEGTISVGDFHDLIMFRDNVLLKWSTALHLI